MKKSRYSEEKTRRRLVEAMAPKEDSVFDQS